MAGRASTPGSAALHPGLYSMKPAMSGPPRLTHPHTCPSSSPPHSQLLRMGPCLCISMNHCSRLHHNTSFPNFSRFDPLLIMDDFVTQGADVCSKSIIASDFLSERWVIPSGNSDIWLHRTIVWCKKRGRYLRSTHVDNVLARVEVYRDTDGKLVVHPKPHGVPHQRSTNDRMPSRTANPQAFSLPWHRTRHTIPSQPAR